MWYRSIGIVTLFVLGLTGTAKTACAQYQLWICSCDQRWGGEIGRWTPYYNTDTNGAYSNYGQAIQVAQRIEANYRSQRYNVCWGVGTRSSAPATDANGQRPSCVTGVTQPTCQTMYSFRYTYFYAGRSYSGSSGFAYSSQSDAYNAAMNFQRAYTNVYLRATGINSQRVCR